MGSISIRVVSAFADWIYRASAIMRVGVAVAVLTAMTEAALPSSSGSVPVPIKKGAPVPFEDQGSLHTFLEGVDPLVTGARVSALPQSPLCCRRRTQRSQRCSP